MLHLKIISQGTTMVVQKCECGFMVQIIIKITRKQNEPAILRSMYPHWNFLISICFVFLLSHATSYRTVTFRSCFRFHRYILETAATRGSHDMWLSVSPPSRGLIEVQPSNYLNEIMWNHMKSFFHIVNHCWIPELNLYGLLQTIFVY